jgi:hypothetical protein
MRWVIGLILVGVALGAGDSAAPRPLVRAHSHNDYEHKRPLLDALEQGFCSVEADVHLIQGTLLVGHDPRELRPDRTLQSLYLEPLKRRINQNGGRVYRGGPTVTLMIDVKSEARSSYLALKEALKPYQDLLTTFRGETIEPRAITIVISGNRDRKTMSGEAVRYAALDGRLEDLDATTPPPAALVAWVSSPWNKVFKWDGKGEMPAEYRAKLKDLVTRAHAQKRLIRFWESPDTIDTWKALSDAGVDLINTDDLAGLAKFLNK